MSKKKIEVNEEPEVNETEQEEAQGRKHNMPFIPFMPYAQYRKARNKSNSDNKAEEKKVKRDKFKNALKEIWMQNIEKNKAFAESNRKQWDQFFDYMMEAQTVIAETMLQDKITLPFVPNVTVSPKAIMRQARKFEEMTNAHLTTQVDSISDFCVKSQEQMYELFVSATEKAETQEEDKAQA